MGLAVYRYEIVIVNSVAVAGQPKYPGARDIGTHRVDGNRLAAPAGLVKHQRHRACGGRPNAEKGGPGGVESAQVAVVVKVVCEDFAFESVHSEFHAVPSTSILPAIPQTRQCLVAGKQGAIRNG